MTHGKLRDLLIVVLFIGNEFIIYKWSFFFYGKYLCVYLDERLVWQNYGGTVFFYQTLILINIYY